MMNALPLNTPIETDTAKPSSLSRQEAYDIICQKDLRFDGQLFVGVSSTGIFCRPGCPARVPLLKNCTFFQTATRALAEGFRACKRCHPASLPREQRPILRRLIQLIESEPERKWSEKDLKEHGIDPSTARRQFKARFGMTFSVYARQRRLGHAAKALSRGRRVIDAQLSAGYESASGFGAAFGKVFGDKANADISPLFIEWIDSPLGPIIVVCDDDALYLLEFTVRKVLDKKMIRLSEKTDRVIVPGRTVITDQIQTELNAYFAGEITEFKTPVSMIGTAFQKQVWTQLQAIRYGQTLSYGDLAKAIGNPKAFRAVASSNANNTLAIVVPCHRVIGSSGSLGGYAGGISRKQSLLDLEQGTLLNRH